MNFITNHLTLALEVSCYILCLKKKKRHKKGTKIIGTNLYHFGRTLAAARRKKGLTRVELAPQLEITSRTISYYEDESKNPSLEMVKKSPMYWQYVPKTCSIFPTMTMGTEALKTTPSTAT
ncbi:MAG: helix-turn-helix transcriptional regulator [Chitinispirillaceae bacterium]|nr:helix-turn-helix transcriptional regulator [Chitinispirillaceae bacterium]